MNDEFLSLRYAIIYRDDELWKCRICRNAAGSWFEEDLEFHNHFSSLALHH